MTGHVSADEVYDVIAAEHPNISRATVYRNLNRLAEMGKIRKIEVPDGADRFEHWSHKHYHVRCEKCGRSFDVDMPHREGLEAHIRGTHGFDFTGHDIIFSGVCPACKNKADVNG